ncbi:hypothetical protein PR048_004405 [Dryococelus australis]|uniref:Uncharacterized protein n=1 Tax=Dryococelus australis TaxID=614101 RepID=A0ABQ9I5C9_9NEOP|nr:hypothetical protein PR048_004405 [Dryococelus australis]
MKGRGKREIPEKTRRPAASSATIPTCGNPLVTRPGIEPGSSWWDASGLNGQPPRPLHLRDNALHSCVLNCSMKLCRTSKAIRQRMFVRTPHKFTKLGDHQHVFCGRLLTYACRTTPARMKCVVCCLPARCNRLGPVAPLKFITQPEITSELDNRIGVQICCTNRDQHMTGDRIELRPEPPNLVVQSRYVHRDDMTWRFLQFGCTQSLIGCARLLKQSLCLIGYCVLRKVPYWLGCCGWQAPIGERRSYNSLAGGAILLAV